MKCVNANCESSAVRGGKSCSYHETSDGTCEVRTCFEPDYSLGLFCLQHRELRKSMVILISYRVFLEIIDTLKNNVHAYIHTEQS